MCEYLRKWECWGLATRLSQWMEHATTSIVSGFAKMTPFICMRWRRRRCEKAITKRIIWTNQATAAVGIFDCIFTKWEQTNHSNGKWKKCFLIEFFQRVVVHIHSRFLPSSPLMRNGKVYPTLTINYIWNWSNEHFAVFSANIFISSCCHQRVAAWLFGLADIKSGNQKNCRTKII